MAVGFGVSPDQNGNSTMPEDIQAITSAEYIWAGILTGCDVQPTSSMSYKITAGAVVIAIDAFHKVKAPVLAQTVPTPAAPATGSRTDIIYVKQNFPASDGNNAVIVGVGTSLPANAVEIGRRTVPAGATSTNQTTVTGNRINTRPVGGSFGVLFSAVDTDGTEHAPGQVLTRGSGSFNLWTDSDVELKLSSCISASDSVSGQQLDEVGSVFYKIYVDDVLQYTWERRFDRVWESKEFSRVVTLDQGRHTVKYTAETRWYPSGNSGKWKVRYGGPNKFSGDDFRVIHRGVATL
ncbi:hypothetical protein VVR12_03350 [Rothia sp. LK2588]|uniref:hypothetical protein n=1 Tax=Rothia sp. LK2588 TaxID=3114369 RepID=UPI0034CDEE08